MNWFVSITLKSDLLWATVQGCQLMLLLKPAVHIISTFFLNKCVQKYNSWWKSTLPMILHDSPYNLILLVHLYICIFFNNPKTCYAIIFYAINIFKSTVLYLTIIFHFIMPFAMLHGIVVIFLIPYQTLSTLSCTFIVLSDFQMCFALNQCF